MNCLLLILALSKGVPAPTQQPNAARLSSEERIALQEALVRTAKQANGDVQYHAQSGFYVPAIGPTAPIHASVTAANAK